MSSSDRMPYLSATTLDQDFLDACQDSLVNQLELAVDLDAPTGTIRISDRNKYVGGNFYQARTKFPVIKRTVGDWLSGQLEFSTLDLTLNNVDGAYNAILPEGADFAGWIGRSITVTLGLRDVASTYTSIFRGTVTPVGGFSRDVKSLRLTARDDHESVNQDFPTTVFLRADWPMIEDQHVGKGLPIIYGDWTVAVNPKGASVPATPVNGASPFVNGKTEDVTISSANPAVVTLVGHRYSADDPVIFSSDGTLPSPLIAGAVYYVVNPTTNTFQVADAPGGTPLDSSGSGQSGNHQVAPDLSGGRANVKFVISENELTDLDQSEIYLHRADAWFRVDEADVTNVLLGNRYFEVTQNPTGAWADGQPFQYAEGDEFFVKVRGKDLSGYDDNAVAIAKDLLKTYGGVTDADFDDNWQDYMDKADPSYPESAVANIKARLWQQEAQPVLQIAVSLLEQVRLETFVDRNLKFKINSLHFEDWQPSPSFQVKNWDVARDSFKPAIDVKNNWNRAKGAYNQLPDSGDEAYETPVFRNEAAIAQAGRDLSKTIIFPNLYVEADVTAQVKAMLALASSYLEIVEATLTWRALLLDIGDFVRLDVRIGSTVYQNVPAMIREIGYDPNGLRIPVKVWSLQMVPFPGWSPGYSGITGGSAAAITQE